MRRAFGHTVMWAALFVGGVAAVLSETVVMLGCLPLIVAGYALGGEVGRQEGRR